MKGLLTDTKQGDLLVDHAAVVGDVDEQVIAAVLLMQPGSLKESPLMGAGIRQDICANVSPFWAADAKQMIRAAGVNVHSIKVNDDGTINIT